MKCPCGCGKDVPNKCFWATEACGKRANKHGLFMPKTDCRSEERKRKKLYLLTKGKK